ncbi:MAG: SpoIIE family protein phosphatase [Bacillota bacterium]
MPGSDTPLNTGSSRAAAHPERRSSNVRFLPLARTALSRPPAGDLVQPAALGLAFGGAVLARATLLGTLAPFHLALGAAAAVRMPWLFLWAAVPALVVRFAAGGPAAALADAISFLLMFVYAWRLRPAAMDEQRAAAHALAVGLACVLAGGLAGAAVYEWNTFGLITVAFRTVLSGLLAVLFARALAPVQRAWWSRPGWDSWVESWRQGPGASGMARDEWLSAAVLAAALIAGLSGLRIGPLDPALAAAGFLIMLLGWLSGIGAGAAAGAAIAALALLNGTVDPVTVAVFAVAGLLAGLFGEYGAVGSAAGFVMGYLLLSAFYRTPGDVLTGLWSVLPAALLFAAAAHPGGIRPVPGALRAEGPAAHAPAPAAAPAAPAAAVIAPAAADTPGGRPPAPSPVAPVSLLPPSVSFRFRRPRGGPDGGWRQAAPRPGRPYPGLAAAAQGGDPLAAGRALLKKYVQLSREMAQAFDQASPSEERFRQRTLSELVHNLAVQVCTGCPHHVTCWDREFFKTYQGLTAVIARRETQGPVTRDHLPRRLAARCPRTEQLAGAINGAYEVYEVSHRWWRRFDDARRTVALQLRAVSDVLERAAAVRPEAAGGERPAGAVPTLPYRVGVARVAKEEKVVSGDSYLHRQVGDDRLVLVLSDGMGAGTRAAAESRTTVGLLEKLLELGFDETEAVRTVNHLLLLRSAGEMFATLDLMLVGLRDGAARFIKIGAAPSFTRRGSHVHVIRAGTLPMGVVNEPDIQITHRVLQRGDLVVMTTDGVTGAWPSPSAAEDWIKGFLANLERDEPRRVAADLLGEALRRSQGNARDDMTVLVLKML